MMLRASPKLNIVIIRANMYYCKNTLTGEMSKNGYEHRGSMLRGPNVQVINYRHRNYGERGAGILKGYGPTSRTALGARD